MMNRDSPIVVGDVVAGLGCLGAKFVDVLDWFKHFLGPYLMKLIIKVVGQLIHEESNKIFDQNLENRDYM